MADTIELTGIANTDAIVLNGVTGAQQITATGSVAQRGPAGPPGPQGIQGPAGPVGPVDTGYTDSQIAALFQDSDLTYTVGSGGDYATVNAAIAALSRKKPVYKKEGFTATIRLLTGFTMAEQVLVKSVDLSWITIVSDDAEVPVDESAIVTGIVGSGPNDDIIPIFGGIDNAQLPIIGALFAYADQGDGYAAAPMDGVAVTQNSKVLFRPGAGVRRARSGLKVLYGSSATCYMPGLTQGGAGSGAGTVTGVDFSYSIRLGLHVGYGSKANLARSMLHHSKGAYGAYVIWGSHVDLYQSQINDTTFGYAITCRDGSYANMRETTVARSIRGYHALHNSRINARNHTNIWSTDGAKNCTGYGVLASANSHIDADEVDVSGSVIGINASNASAINFYEGIALNCSNRGVSAVGGSTIDAYDVDVIGSGTGFYAEGGSIINCNSTSANNCTSIGYHSYMGSTINADTSSATGCGTDAYRADETSVIQARNSSANNAGNIGFFANRGSRINARGSSATGCVIGFSAFEASTINAQSTTATSSSTWGYSVDRDGRINAGARNGTTNIPINYRNGKGYISDATAPNTGDYINVKEYGALGDGSTNDTAAIQSAMDAANTSGKGLFFPGGNYVCTQFYRGYLPKIWAIPGTVTILSDHTSDYTWNFGETSYDTAVNLTADANANTRVLQVPTTGFSAGDIVAVRSNTTDGGVAYLQTTRISSIDSSSQMTLADPLYQTYLTSATARVQRSKTIQNGGYVRGIKFRNIAASTNTAGALRFFTGANIDVETESELYGQSGVELVGCYQVRVKHSARMHYDIAVTGTTGQFGYGVNVTTGNAHVEVNVMADQVRHAVACNGANNNIRITGIAHATTSSAWDAHAGSVNVTFDNCHAYGAHDFGFNLRGRRQHIHGGVADGCLGGAFIFDFPSENVIDGLKVSNTRDNADGNRGNGIVVSNSLTKLTITNCSFYNIARSAISLRGGTLTDVVISNNEATNVGLSGVSNERNFIRQLSASHLTRARIFGNYVGDNQGSPTLQYAFQLASNSSSDVSFFNNAVHNISPSLVFNGPATGSGVAKISRTFINGQMVDKITDVTYSATPTFEASASAIQRITLTGNVTSSTIANPTDGQVLQMIIVQDATGGRTFAWPSNVTPTPIISAAANATSIHVLTYTASNSTWTPNAQSLDPTAYQPADATLTSLAAYNTNGLVTQTAADTFTGRTIVGTTNQVSVTNGDGVSGNPTLSLPQNIDTAASPTFTAVRVQNILDSNGNVSVQAFATASAVNYLRVTNAISGNAVLLSAQGADTNVSWLFRPKGTGTTSIQTSSGTGALQVSNSGDVIAFNKLSAGGSNAPSTFTLAAGNFGFGTATTTNTDLTLGSHSIVYVSASTGNRIITLPAVTGLGSRFYWIQRNDSTVANTVTIAVPSGSVLDGVTDGTVVLRNQNDFVMVIADATGWRVWGAKSSGISFSRRAVADADVTVNATDYMVSYTSLTTSRTVTLPAPSATAGSATRSVSFLVKDESGSASGANTITVQISGGATIDGAASKTIMNAYGSIRLYTNGTAYFTS